MEDSVAAKSKLPTKMFFISVVCLSIVRARLGRFGPRPGCCRTLKRLFKYSRTLPTGRHGYAELQERSSPLFHRNVPNLLAARPAFRALHFQRSEERRVGKECRSLSAPFLSSRRRHTRCLSDWSSDVCSSDLRSAPPHYFTATSQIFSRLDLPSAPSTSRVTV